MKSNFNLNINKDLLGDLIYPHLNLLQNNRHENQQKILELCQVGKFLLSFNGEIIINQLSEKPDFILKFGSTLIGCEHMIIVDNEEKQKEGFYENIFSIVENQLRKDQILPNFLANCYISKKASYKINEKEDTIQIIKNVISQFVLSGILIENPFIRKISSMPHSQISLSPNHGAWIQKIISADKICQAIRKKEAKIEEYRKKNADEIWLLMVIGSTGASSYEWDQNIKIDIETKFNKIFVLEDFDNKVHIIK